MVIQSITTWGRCSLGAVLVGGGGGRGAARLDVFQMAGVTEEDTVQRVAAVTLLVVQLLLTILEKQGFYK